MRRFSLALVLLMASTAMAIPPVLYSILLPPTVDNVVCIRIDAPGHVLDGEWAYVTLPAGDHHDIVYEDIPLFLNDELHESSTVPIDVVGPPIVVGTQYEYDHDGDPGTPDATLEIQSVQTQVWTVPEVTYYYDATSNTMTLDWSPVGGGGGGA